MKFAAYLLLAVVLAILLPFLVPDIGRRDGVDPQQNLPWSIAVKDGRTQVFGVSPGYSALAEVQAALPCEWDLALIAAPGELGQVEAYCPQVALGFVLAKMVLTLDFTEAEVSSLRERAVKAEHMESTTKKIRLHPDDVLRAQQQAVRAFAVIPTVNLDESVIVQRFGAPAERVPVSDTRVHLLYPAQGLDVVLDREGKELLQYVAPAEFPRLANPLRAQ